MSRILIVFKSSHGQTREVAEFIATRLHPHDVVRYEVGSRGPSPDPTDFDAIVVGAPIHFGRHSRKLVRFVRRHREALEARPNAFFSVCMSAASTNPEDRARETLFIESFLRRSGWRPNWVASFAGALRYTRYGPILRRVMRRIAEQSGVDTDTSRDWIYTDWQAVADFTDDLAKTLPLPDIFRDPVTARPQA